MSARSPAASVGSDPIEPDEVLAVALKALAHPKRLRLLRFVTEPRSVEEIAGDLKLARQSAQEHVDQLLEHGLIEPRSGRGERGLLTRYVLSVPRMFDLLDSLGTHAGMMAAEIEEDVRTSMPTSPLPAREPDAAHRTMPRLVIVHGMRVGQTILLQGNGPWLVGRDPAATMCLDYDPYVSQRHAEVRRGASDFEVVDALSSNGTLVDWQRVPRGGALPLANGALLRFGKTLVLFRTA
jgi:DNA-binding transcriptional ArsR family regulator